MGLEQTFNTKYQSCLKRLLLLYGDGQIRLLLVIIIKTVSLHLPPLVRPDWVDDMKRPDELDDGREECGHDRKAVVLEVVREVTDGNQSHDAECSEWRRRQAARRPIECHIAVHRPVEVEVDDVALRWEENLLSSS